MSKDFDQSEIGFEDFFTSESPSLLKASEPKENIIPPKEMIEQIIDTNILCSFYKMIEGYPHGLRI